MQKTLAFLLVLAFSTAGAEVFRRIGPDGEVYFSDTPSLGAERVELAPAQSLRMPAVPPRNLAEPNSAAAGVDPSKVVPAYAQFMIVKPSNDQGVRANDGSVTVYLSLQPALMPGHTIELKVDGEDGPKLRAGDALNFNLSNMSRGRHTVAARVVDKRGEALIQTGPVGFYVLRAALGRR